MKRRLLITGFLLSAAGITVINRNEPASEAESVAVSLQLLNAPADAFANVLRPVEAVAGLNGWPDRADQSRVLLEMPDQLAQARLPDLAAPAVSQSTPYPTKRSTAPGTRSGNFWRPVRTDDARGFSPAGADGRVTQAEVDALEDGLSQTLAAIEIRLVTEVFGETYPLVGDNFRVAWSNNVANFRYLTKLRGAILSGLATLNSQPDYLPSEVASPINARLTSSNFITSTVLVTTAGDQAQLAFTTSDTFTSGAVPLEQNFGVPNLDLHLTDPTNGQTTANWTFNFNVGVDGGGFYLETLGGAFTVNTTTTINSLNAAGRFTRLPYNLRDNNTSGATRTSIPLNFTNTLKDPNSDGKVRVAELSGTPDLLDATVSGSTKIALKLLSSVPASAMLPQVGTDLTLVWFFSAAPVNPTDDNENFGGKPSLILDNNRVNLHSFFNSFAGRALQQIDETTEPLQPVIDALTFEIPLLSDLGSDQVTILDLFGVDEATVDAIGGLAALLDLANAASGFTGNENVFVDLGGYSLESGDLRVQTLDEIPGLASRPPENNPSQLDDDLEDFLGLANGISGLSFPVLTNASVAADLLLGRIATLFSYRSGEIGFSEDLGPLFFPVLGPVGVTLGGHIGMKTEFAFGYDTQGILDYHAGGGVNENLLFNGFFALALDELGDPLTGIELSFGVTAGIEANIGIASVGVEGDITATVGFYLDDLKGDAQGRVRGSTLADFPVDDLFYASGQLSAGLRAYLEIGWPPFGVEFEFESPRVVILNFDSRDTDVPVLAEPGSANPAQLVLNIGDRAHRRIHGDLTDRAEEITITNVLGNLVVSGFGHENTLTDPFFQIVANSGNRGDLIYVHPDVTIPVMFSGGDKRDLLTGGGGSDELNGGDGPDRLRGQGGNNHLRGEADNDELIAGLGSNTLDGGPGLDTASWADAPVPVIIDLRTGTFSGGAAFDTLISIERYKGTTHDDTMDGSEGHDLLLRGLRGHDTIRGHGGDDLLEGDAGNDTLLGGAGNDMVNGGAGADTLDGGDGIDTLSYLASGVPLLPLAEGSPVTVSLLTGTGTRGDAAGDVFSNFEILIGSGVPQGVTVPAGSGDDLTGSDNADTIHGMGGADLIKGAGGNDIIYGDNNIFPTEYPAEVAPLMAGFDADTIYGGAGEDQLFGQTDNDKLYGGADNDMLDGGVGDDQLDGDEGMDTLIGGEDNDHLITFDLLSPDLLDGGPGINRLSADFSDQAVPFRFTVGTNNAFTFPDGDRYTNMHTLGTLKTGPSNDVIRLSRGAEHQYHPKTIDGGEGDDLLIADWRGFYTVGGQSQRSPDALHGGNGNDTLSFEQSIAGVVANLVTFELAGAAQGMAMSGFENLTGTDQIDILTGDAGSNVFRPMRGYPGTPNSESSRTSDFIDAGAAGGAGGVDTLVIDYSQQPEANQLGVFMDNAINGIAGIYLGPARTGGGAPGAGPGLHAHRAIDVFHITGGATNDLLITYAAAYSDRFIGLGGDDILNSGAGDDYLDGGEGNDTIEAGIGSETIFGGPGNDIIIMDVSNQPGPGYGTDKVDAGPGDDWVLDTRDPLAGSSLADATTIFQFDGGPGTDVFSVDLGNLTEPVIFSEHAPTDLVFTNGSFIRNFERIERLIAGAGDDVLWLAGRFNNEIVLGDGDDNINPGLGIDTVSGSGAGNDLLILDYSVGDDANTTGVTLFSSGDHHQRRRISDNVQLDLLTAVGIERLHLTGTSKDDVAHGFTGNDLLFSGAGNDTLTGQGGDDWLDGGTGADALTGNSGDDTYIVDNAGDVVTESFNQGTDLVRSSVDFTLPDYVEHLTLTGIALNGTGNTLSNDITGNNRNNYLQGGSGNDRLNGGGGAGEVDRLNGGLNADTFILGDGSVRYYEDGSTATPGLNGYAIIEDFTPSQTDRLRLSGNQAQYLLGASPVIGVPGTALYHDSNGNAALDPATDELIAILVSGETLTTTNTLGSASYTAPVNPAVIGLTPLQPLITDDGAGQRFVVEFTLSEPMPAGVLLEIQASTDLGVDDPWQTIASKNGPGAWTGLAGVEVSAPVEGRVTITVADLQRIAQMPQDFFRVRLSAP